MYIGFYVPLSDGDYEFLASVATGEEGNEETAKALTTAIRSKLAHYEPDCVEFWQFEPDFDTILEEEAIPQKWVVETYTLEGWKNVWKDMYPDGQKLSIYPNRNIAISKLRSFIHKSKQALRRGELQEFDPDLYRLAPYIEPRWVSGNCWSCLGIDILVTKDPESDEHICLNCLTRRNLEKGF